MTQVEVQVETTGRVSINGLMYGACMHCNGNIVMGNATSIQAHCTNCGVMYAFANAEQMKKAGYILTIIEKRFPNNGTGKGSGISNERNRMIRMLATRVNIELARWAEQELPLTEHELLTYIKDTKTICPHCSN